MSVELRLRDYISFYIIGRLVLTYRLEDTQYDSRREGLSSDTHIAPRNEAVVRQPVLIGDRREEGACSSPSPNISTQKPEHP